MIDRMEILRLAMNKATDARDALQLAREMEAWLTGGTPEPAYAAQQNTAPAPPAKASSKSADRQRKHWAPDDQQRAASLLDQGASIEEVASALGRTTNAVRTALSKGKLPCKTFRPNPLAQLSGAISAIARGQQVSPRVRDAVLKGTHQ
jgi:DNA-directed RNA polymerase specialized sigma24 family protein